MTGRHVEEIVRSSHPHRHRYIRLREGGGFSLETSLTKFEQFVHFWVLVWRSFVRNRCPVRAAALSYTTLLALIPMLAVAMSLSSFLLKSKGKEQIGAFIQQFMPTSCQTRPPETNASPDEFETFAQPANAPPRRRYVAHQCDQPSRASATEPRLRPWPPRRWCTTPGSWPPKNGRPCRSTVSSEHQQRDFGHMGVVVSDSDSDHDAHAVEETFNDIWGVARGRDWWSRITNYTFTIGFGPVLLIGARIDQRPAFAEDQESSGRCLSSNRC